MPEIIRIRFVNGKKVLEVIPRQLVRVARLTQGWMIIQHPAFNSFRKESSASSPS